MIVLSGARIVCLARRSFASPPQGLRFVNDPVIARFADACGATGPLDLRVDLAEGGVLAEGSVGMPFALVGRADACDVTLTDADVNPRHAWLQVVGGRVFAVDLGSRTGLGWPSPGTGTGTGAGAGTGTGSGWLDPDVPVGLGPFQLRLRCPVSPRPVAFPPGYNPLQSDAAATRSRSPIVLEFRNGRRARDRWVVNRLITLVGRAPECKIHLTADDIAGYHCGLVLTPDGLWVVDLSGRGVVVNGERMRVSPLGPGAELWVGRFLIGVHYPVGGRAAPAPPVGRPAGQTSTAAGGPVEDEDAVQLGVAPPADPATGLPSSHIMADAFRLWSAPTASSGPVSNPILVSGSGPTPPSIPVPASVGQPRPVPPTTGLPDLFTTPAPGENPADAVVVPLLRQLGEVHGQMFAQFQQSLMLMVQLFACLRREQLPAMQRELARIQELNSELAQLQGEVARRAAAELAAGPGRSLARVTPSTQTPLPDPHLIRTPAPDSTALHDWVIDRINSLQQERQTRWQSLVGLFGGKPA